MTVVELIGRARDAQDRAGRLLGGQLSFGSLTEGVSDGKVLPGGVGPREQKELSSPSVSDLREQGEAA